MNFGTISEVVEIDNELDSIRNFVQDMYNTSIEESDGKGLHVFPWIYDCGVSPSQQIVYVVLHDRAYDFLSRYSYKGGAK